MRGCHLWRVLLGLAVATAVGCAAEEPRWRLVYEETFDAPVSDELVPWQLDPGGDESPWHAGPLDDDGEYFQVHGGEAFQRQLASFNTFRKRLPFGQDGWLTAELAARDRNKDGVPEGPPRFTRETLPDGRTVGRMLEPDHHGGILVRGTHPLPPRYRIEVTLVTFEFGGSRYDRWGDDKQFNGYALDGQAKTRHPWQSGSEVSMPYDQWQDVRNQNGFYFLAILDHSNPAPRNNLFIHAHRKVAMDSYTTPPDKAEFLTCNPATGEFYRSHDNTVNMLFLSPRAPSPDSIPDKMVPMTETQAGISYGRDSGHSSVVSAVQLVPELLPHKTYRFAVERDETGYVMEMSGFFRFVGEQTYRYRRDFVQDGRAIWHYNQTPEEYDGRFDAPWSFKGPFGTHTLERAWPAGSAYPDYFIVGEPFTNYYEGSASIDDIRLYVPAD